ncbi:MAG: 50S ribosomal protein L22 [Candidatus Nanohaloarchaea archaeon]|nr:50S ribosomal protein L22 [Candidatus Nanohaloarchaea archaeon]
MSEQETEQEALEAKARGVNLSVSRKHCVEIGRFIKGDSVEKAKNKLERVIDKELAVPYTKYNSDLAHRKGGKGPGRYPVNASEEVLELLKSAEQNAIHDHGMAEDNLYISEFYATQGSRFQTPRRHRGEKPKSAHVTIKLREKQ